MRFVSSALILGVAALSLTASAAQAGSLSYSDGRGGWKSTMCVKPERPAALPKDPEAMANDLNTRVEAYNAYAAQTQAYLDCLTKEVEHDAQSTQYVLTEASKKQMQAVQDELAEIHGQLERKK